ncbi:hypothetical protein [Kocuria sp.]|uniref:hypothetical protein n=1 Tax=Kocuria sp. TaxID=1871328 RepID=UPI0026DB6328|nr:hypothetical protein [Kocuria sp.]MDO4919820.1 hypothetical protein [Kocuria sp.]
MSHRSMRLVAARAAEAGWLAVRIAWSGTSESGERPSDRDPVAVWHRDLAVAYETARELVGPDLPVHGIGLRLGSALLATSPLPFETRVLWEPVSGAAYLRQYTGLRRMSGLQLPPETGQGVEIGGMHFTDAEAAAVRALPDPRQVHTPGLVPVREQDRSVAKKLYGVATIYAKASPDAIAALVARLEDSSCAAVPRADWADAGRWRPVTAARLHVAEFGVDVSEELLELGPDRLPATYTHPVGRHGTGNGAVLLAPPSVDPKDGPTGLWTVQARRLAARGVPTLRVERHHCGDASGVDQLADVNPYTAQGMADLDMGAAWLRERTGEEVTGAGLCLGGWLVAMAPPSSAMTRRVLINNVSWRCSSRYYARLYRDWDVDPVLDRLRTMNDVALPRTWRTRLKNRVRRHMPYPVWLALGRCNLPNVPEVVMEYATRGAELSLYFGPEDGQVFREERGEEGLVRLQKQGRRVEVHHVPELDHSLQAHASRLAAMQIIDNAVGLVGDTRLDRHEDNTKEVATCVA